MRHRRIHLLGSVQEMKFSQKTRDLIHHRAKGRCEICGLPVIDGQIHHRRPRGMGGTKRKETGTASNGLYVHLKCHARVESNRSEGLAKGWIVSQQQDPCTVPVVRWDGLFLLADDGTVTSLNKVADVDSPGVVAFRKRIPGSGSVGVVVDHSSDAPVTESKDV